MQARLVAFVLWAAVAATVVFWALRLGARAPAVPAQAVAVSTAAGARGDLGRLLGQRAPATEEAPAVSPDAGRFQLVGVVAPRSGGDTQGLALIAVDGKPARTYRVGAAVDDRYVLQSVRTRGAALGPRGGDAQIQLDLPPPPAASTGVLPPAGSEEAATAPAARTPMPMGGTATPRNLPPGQAAQPMPQGMPPQGVPRQPIPPQDMPMPQQEVEPPPMAEPAQEPNG
ncbi:type II secretion system protein N [Azohydromonas caseinilytica]|uniref:Type II secretion system protein GspC N-terminal domain-containing protein n=1 Tax=Azohydromonas caseinilytica TaxID=2728836 RepID=A0A848F427_9BURK|nr:type II secretion system protein N [Azohydromonas caseinilytica]NML13465.1 hypothetical protein [Azohydromonas caseinilytica]